MAFERVETEAILIGRVRKTIAWDKITDYKGYRDIMESVDNVIVHERSETEGKSEWFVSIEEAPLTWVEKDYYDSKNFEVRFTSLDGDFDNINGRWKINDYEGKGIKILFEVDYNLGIPVIEEVLGHILKQKMKSNIDMMIKAIKKELDRIDIEERNYERHGINTSHEIILGEEKVEAYIINISRGGIFFYYTGVFDSVKTTLAIGTISVEAEVLFNDINNKNARLVFKRIISEEELDECIRTLKPD
jgi:ribosome-associated toxin RatA of RatAB toxin-antitoxin module